MRVASAASPRLVGCSTALMHRAPCRAERPGGPRSLAGRGAPAAGGPRGWSDRRCRSADRLRVQRLRLPDGEVSWTVLGEDWLPAGPVEEFLEYMRATGRSPNTVQVVRAGAGAVVGVSRARRTLAGMRVRSRTSAAFLTWLRSGDTSAVVSIVARAARGCRRTRSPFGLQAVMSLYRHHQLNGVEARVAAV